MRSIWDGSRGPGACAADLAPRANLCLCAQTVAEIQQRIFPPTHRQFRDMCINECTSAATPPSPNGDVKVQGPILILASNLRVLRRAPQHNNLQAIMMGAILERKDTL